MWREDLQFAFNTGGDQDVSVPVNWHSYWPLGYRPWQHATSPCGFNSVHCAVLVVRYVQPSIHVHTVWLESPENMLYAGTRKQISILFWPDIFHKLCIIKNHFTKLGELIIRKIIKIVATRCQILRLNCTKSISAGGASPRFLAGIKRTYTCKGREWVEKEDRKG